MLLRTENLTKDYGLFRALEALNLEVAPGEVFGLLGPNGSGKSTALRILLGFLKPTSGRATIAGHDCWQNSSFVRHQVAYLPGELRLYENMTGLQLTDFLGKIRGSPNGPRRERLARTLDLDLSRPLAQLSSGMKRKVALLAVLLTGAPLLILDEPTNTLDPTMRDQLLDFIRQAKNGGQAVLFSSHVLHEVEKVCDRVGILQRGRLVHLQNMSELREIRRIHATFSEPVANWPNLTGLQSFGGNPNRLVCDYSGPLKPLLDWLGTQQVIDLHMEPSGLSPIYHRYHGTEE